MLPGHQSPCRCPTAPTRLLLSRAAALPHRCRCCCRGRLLRLCPARRLLSRSGEPDQQQGTFAARTPLMLCGAAQAKPWVSQKGQQPRRIYRVSRCQLPAQQHRMAALPKGGASRQLQQEGTVQPSL